MRKMLTECFGMVGLLCRPKYGNGNGSLISSNSSIMGSYIDKYIVGISSDSDSSFLKVGELEDLFIAKDFVKRMNSNIVDSLKVYPDYIKNDPTSKWELMEQVVTLTKIDIE
jgi:hypothetical protein